MAFWLYLICFPMKMGVAISLNIKGKLLFCARQRFQQGCFEVLRCCYKDDCARLWSVYVQQAILYLPWHINLYAFPLSAIKHIAKNKRWKNCREIRRNEQGDFLHPLSWNADIYPSRHLQWSLWAVLFFFRMMNFIVFPRNNWYDFPWFSGIQRECYPAVLPYRLTISFFSAALRPSMLRSYISKSLRMMS